MRPPMTEDELWHFGIKGMRWGVRRFQNPDGTRTPAGLKRYHDKPAFMSKRKYKKQLKAQAAKQEQRKSIRDMSDEELDYAIRRAQKEKQLEELWKDPQVQTKGKNKVKEALKETGMKLLKDAAYKVGMDKIDKMLKAKDPDIKLKRAMDKFNYSKSKHDFERQKAREPFKDEREQFDLNRDRFNLEKDQYNFQKKKDKDRREEEAARKFYYQPKPSQYPALPGPGVSSQASASVKKKKKKKK